MLKINLNDENLTVSVVNGDSKMSFDRNGLKMDLNGPEVEADIDITWDKVGTALRSLNDRVEDAVRRAGI